MAQTINIEALFDQKYRDASVPFPIDGSTAGTQGALGAFNVADGAAAGFGNGSHDDTSQILSTIAACHSAGGGVVYFPAPKNRYIVSASLPTYSNIVYQGGGSQNTIIQLANGANCDMFLGDQFATLTGGYSGTGPRQWAIRGFKLYGNRDHNTLGYGIRVFGFNYVLSDIEVYYFAEKGIYSEWSEYDPTFSNTYWTTNKEFGTEEPRWYDLEVHHNLLGGIVLNGPHDAKIFRVTTAQNGPDDANASTTTAGFEIGDGTQSKPLQDNGTGAVLIDCHSWGVKQNCAYTIAGTNVSMIGCQAEGGKKAQVWVLAGGLNIRGGRFFRGDNRSSDIAFWIGDSGRSGYQVGGHVFDTYTTKGRIFFDSDGGNSVFKLNTYSPWGIGTHTTASATLPTGTITVANTAGFPSQGSLLVAGSQVVAYTGVTATSFTGCTGGTGAVASNSEVLYATTLTSGATLPTGTLNVASTFGFPATNGTLQLGTTTNATAQVQYSAIGSGNITFTGCVQATGTAISGTFNTGDPVTFQIRDGWAPYQIITGTQHSLKFNQFDLNVSNGGVPGSEGSLGRKVATRPWAKSVLSDLPTGAKYQTMRRQHAGTDNSNLSSGRLSINFLGTVEAGDTISSVTLVSGNTAAVSPTNQWFALIDANTLKTIAVTVDDTTTAWGTAAAKTLAIGQIMMGASLVDAATWTPLVDTTIFIGVCVAAATVPTLSGNLVTAGVSGLAPIIYGTSSGSLTTPGTIPLTILSPTAATKNFYAYLA